MGPGRQSRTGAAYFVFGTLRVVADVSLGHPVPTAITRAPDGGVYVGFLSSGAHLDGTSKVVKVSDDGEVTDFWTGLTMVTGLFVGSGRYPSCSGNVYREHDRSAQYLSAYGSGGPPDGRGEPGGSGDGTSTFRSPWNLAPMGGFMSPFLPSRRTVSWRHHSRSARPAGKPLQSQVISCA